MAKGQLSLEFLFAILIYVSFMAILLNAQQSLRSKLKEDFSAGSSARLTSLIISEQRINNALLSMPIRQNCIITETEVVCQSSDNAANNDAPMSEYISIGSSTEGYLE
jgi:hypothetical protein